jgi:P4 family phage/plasmid primase-like protien
MVNIITIEKQKELKELFKDTDITIGTSDEILNIDTSVYREGMSKMRCVNAYKFVQQKKRINKLIKGEIEDTIISYIPKDAKKCTYSKPITKKIVKKTVKKVVESDSDSDSEEDEEDDLKTKKYFQKTEDNSKTKQHLIELLDGLKNRRWTDYGDWIKIYCVFINENLDINIFNKYSKTSDKYNKEDNINILKSIKICEGYKYATLYHMLKEDDIKVFNKLQKERQDIWKIIENVNHHDFAKLYYSLVPHKYIKDGQQKKNNGWYEYNNKNIIMPREDVPASLLNDLSNKLQTYIIEVRNVILPKDEKYKIKMGLITKAYNTLGTCGFIESTIKFLTYLYTVDDVSKLFDSKPHLFAFKDYVYDIKLGTFRDIEPTDYITVTTAYNAPVKKDKKGNFTFKTSKDMRTKINKLITSIFENDEMEEYYKIITGLSIFTNKLQSVYIHTGSGGNGKGILSTIIMTCLGDYYLTAENTFLNSFPKEDRANPTLTKAKGKRYLSVSEPSDSKETPFNIPFLKSLSGGDKLTTRDLNKSNFSYMPQFTVNVQCNSKPKLGNKIEKALVRRFKILLYPFNFVDNPQSKNERQRDYNLTDLITKDEFRDEFMIMLIEKAHEYYNKDYAKDIIIPSIVLDETKDYIDENNYMKDWIEQALVTSKDIKDRIKTTELHRLYNESECAEVQLNSMDAVKCMTFNGFEIKKIGGVKYYINCKFKDVFEKDFSKSAFSKSESN